jgi:hypothetical protein
VSVSWKDAPCAKPHLGSLLSASCPPQGALLDHPRASHHDVQPLLRLTAMEAANQTETSETVSQNKSLLL